jgi:peptide chain release factor 2
MHAVSGCANIAASASIGLTCTKEVMMELDAKDLKIDTYRPAGSGGLGYQPDVGIRITHIPSGLYTEEHSDRSQHRNRVEALRKMQHAFDLKPDMFESAKENLQHAELRRAWDAYRGDAELSLDEAFLFAAGYIAGSKRK